MCHNVFDQNSEFFILIAQLHDEYKNVQIIFSWNVFALFIERIDILLLISF